MNSFTSTHDSKTLAAAVVLGAAALWASPAAAEPTIVELTQVGCQFLETENGVNHGFQPQQASDCEAINARTAEERLEKAKTLRLKAGKTIFRVTNVNVPYPLGFWVRGDGVLNRARLPSVSGGGLVMGTTKEYEIDLKPGEYVYSCPLNPTPNYKLIVSG